MLKPLSIEHAIRDDKVLPPTPTYLKAHSRAHLARFLLRHGLLIGMLSIATDL
jgi:hypothetical protein